MTASAGPLGHAGGTSFDFLPGWSNLDRPKWPNRFTRYPRVPRNPFPSDGPNNPNNKQNFANIFNGSQQQGCNAALPFPKPMRIASSCRSSLNFRKIFHGNDRNNHRNQSPPLGRGYSTISNSVVTSALRCQCQYSRRLRRGLSLLEVLGLQSRWLGRQFSIRHPGSRKRATKTWRLLNLYTVSSLQIQSMSNLKNEQLEE